MLQSLSLYIPMFLKFRSLCIWNAEVLFLMNFPVGAHVTWRTTCDTGADGTHGSICCTWEHMSHSGAHDTQGEHSHLGDRSLLRILPDVGVQNSSRFSLRILPVAGLQNCWRFCLEFCSTLGAKFLKVSTSNPARHWSAEFQTISA